MAQAKQILPPSLAPRGLRRAQSAAYVGLSPTKFDELVKDGRMPTPKIVDGCVVWDRLRLDEAFEALPDRTKSGNPWDAEESAAA